MAKIKMLCPFSKELCRECALYRGRHYYLCFCKEYRGHLGEEREAGVVNPETSADIDQRFKIPPVIASSAIDPFGKMLKDID